MPYSGLPLEVVVLRMFAAMILGGVIGFEREARDRPAGLRTHISISLAACLFTLIAFEMLAMPEPVDGDGRLRIDPLRLIEAVTSGVAFLAAGSIITSGGKVKGLTTGASMWLAGAIGLACGSGNLVLGAIAAVLVLIVLAALRWMKHQFGWD
ncbi:MgtC/SapB family protein [Halovulum sp. GXIMD14794]